LPGVFEAVSLEVVVITRQYGIRGREWRLNVALGIITNKIRVLAIRLSLYIVLASLDRSAKGLLAGVISKS
jgi:hypothetical protein